jgi:hypothetical protein
MLTVWETLSYPGGGTPPAGSWIFDPTTGPSKHPISVSPVGMAQAITQLDPTAIVLVYSWLDGSATPEGLANGRYSQANTDMFGLIAGQAVLMALSPDFSVAGGRLHLIGHSDGTKVLTIAAAELIEAGVPVAQLTLFDSPENSQARNQNSANFLWYYLPRVPGTRPASGPHGTFIDSYISMFGTELAAFSFTDPNGKSFDLSRIVDTYLASDVLYGDSPEAYGERHAYSPAWYSGTSVDTKYGGNVNGLGWSPLLHAPSVAGGLPQEQKQTWRLPLADKQYHLGSNTASPQSPVFTSMKQDPVKLTASLGKPGSQTVAVDVPVGSVDGFTFAYKFETAFPPALSGTMLTVSLDGQMLFMMEGQCAGSQARTATLNAAGLRLGKGTLTFTLTYNGPAWVNATIADLSSFGGLTH